MAIICSICGHSALLHGWFDGPQCAGNEWACTCKIGYENLQINKPALSTYSIEPTPTGTYRIRSIDGFLVPHTGLHNGVWVREEDLDRKNDFCEFPTAIAAALHLALLLSGEKHS